MMFAITCGVLSVICVIFLGIYNIKNYVTKENRCKSLSLVTFYTASLVASSVIVIKDSFIMKQDPLSLSLIGLGFQLSNFSILIIGSAKSVSIIELSLHLRKEEASDM